MENRFENTFHLLTAMWKKRCKMIHIQNKKNAKRLAGFLIEEYDGTIRNPTGKEEFVMCVCKISRIQSKGIYE